MTTSESRWTHRSLDYELYFERRRRRASAAVEDYASHNTERLDVEPASGPAAHAPGDSRRRWPDSPMKIVAHRRRRLPRLARTLPSGGLTDHKWSPSGVPTIPTSSR